MDFIHSFKTWLLHTNDHEVETQNIDKHNIKTEKQKEIRTRNESTFSGVFFLKDQQCP